MLTPLWSMAWGLFGLWLISFFIFAINLQSKMHQATTVAPVKAIIVLGSGAKNGQPTPTLARRLDAAAPIAKAQPTAITILSGGLDAGETQSEALAMANYLKTHYQLPTKQLILEDKSTSTELNLKNSQPILAKHHIRLTDPIAIVTSDFHTLRSAAIARKQGYQNITLVGSPTPLSIRYNAWLREYFAYISGWLLGEY